MRQQIETLLLFSKVILINTFCDDINSNYI